MALKTKTISSTTTANDFTLKLELTENSTSGNSSSVSWALKLYSGGWNFSDYAIGWSVSLSGTVVSSKDRADAPQKTLGRNTYITIASGTNSISHDADGTKTMSASASIYMEKVSYTPGNMSLSGGMALTDIPREASISKANNVTMGENCSVTWTPASSTHKFKIKFTIGNYDSGWSGFISPAKASAYTYEGFTVPTTVANQVTASTKGTMTAHLLTYTSGGTQIGTEKTKTFYVYVPASVVPSISAAALSAVNEDATVEGWGIALQGYSRLHYEVTAAGAQGSTIQNVKTIVEGSEYTGASGNTGIIQGDGTITAQITVTDSRGRTATAQRTITVYGYHVPALSESKAVRCTQDGTQSDTGTYAAVKCTATCASANEHNSVSCRVRYRQTGAGWSVHTTLPNGQESVKAWSLNTTYTYDVEISAVDALGNETKILYKLQTEKVAFHLRAGGTGAAFGKYAEQDELLECDWDAQFNGAVTVGGKTIGDLIYPVGSIYLSVSSTDPAALFGGTWERIKDRFLLASGDSYEAASTGGEATHTLTVDEMPSHNHDIAAYKSGSTAIAGVYCPQSPMNTKSSIPTI